jgi:hypothetical protein
MNILGLAKKGKRELLEAACLEIKTRQGIPTYTSVKNTMAAIVSQGKLAQASCEVKDCDKADTLGDAGMIRGADYYSMKGEGK